jgi:hypothetical protein
MNSKIFLFVLVGILPMSSFAEYRMNVKFSDPSSISFGTVSNPGEETPEEPTEPTDTCPTNMPMPTFASGYPSIQKSVNSVSYSVQITAAGGYSTYAEVAAGQATGTPRFVKMLMTQISGNSYPANGGLYAGTLQAWVINSGQSLNVTMIPIVFDNSDGSVCATGTPFQLVSKTYAQLYSEAP